MKISKLTHFPYPVLSKYTGDYREGEFSAGIETAENLKTGALKIRYNMKVAENYVLSLLSDNTACPAISVTCLETYYNRVHKQTLMTGVLEIDKGQLSGTVRILPMIILQKDVEDFFSGNQHEEFGTKPVHIDTGSILAIGDEYQVNVGREKLAPIESIFEISRLDSVPYGQFRVSLESEKITILAEEKTYNFINSLRNVGHGRDILLNSVYQPALMEVLSTVSLDDGAYQGKRWHKVFKAKCTHMNVNTESPELLTDTQKMLKTPFNKIINLSSMLE